MTLDIRPFMANLNRENNPLHNRTPRITVQRVVAQLKWTPVYIWQPTASEAKELGIEGQANCFVVPLTRFGLPVYGDSNVLTIRYGWEGMRPDETPPNTHFEKPFPEPAGNVSLFGEAKYWVEIADTAGFPSDRVTGITLANPDDTDPHAHHSTLVFYQIQYQDERPDGGTVTVALAELRRLQKQIRDMADALAKLG